MPRPRSAPGGSPPTLTVMHAELLAHMQKEEMILFPAHDPSRAWAHWAMAPISVMRHEHIDHAGHLGRWPCPDPGASPPPQACTTWRTLWGAWPSCAAADASTWKTTSSSIARTSSWAASSKPRPHARAGLGRSPA